MSWRNVKSGKGQMKIQQMAFMLVAVILFFALAGMFVFSFKFANLKEMATELESKNAMLLATKIANSPEFACGDSFGTRKVNCVDGDKVMMLKEGIEKYEGFWSVENIEVRKIYPAGSNIECNLGNYPNCDYIRVYAKEVSGYSHSNFVTLCRKEVFEGETYDKCDLARILVSYEEK